jgi:hypothetical protein
MAKAKKNNRVKTNKAIFRALEPVIQLKENVDVIPLFGDRFRINIRQHGQSEVSRSYFIRANAESGVFYSNPPMEKN